MSVAIEGASRRRRVRIEYEFGLYHLFTEEKMIAGPSLFHLLEEVAPGATISELDGAESVLRETLGTRL